MWKASRRSKLSNLAGETLYHPTTRALRPRSRRLHRHRGRDPPSHHPSTTSHPPLTVTKTSSRQLRRLRCRILHTIRQCMRTEYNQERFTWRYLGEKLRVVMHMNHMRPQNCSSSRNEMTLMTRWSNYCIRESANFLHLRSMPFSHMDQFERH